MSRPQRHHGKSGRRRSIRRHIIECKSILQEDPVHLFLNSCLCGYNEESTSQPASQLAPLSDRYVKEYKHFESIQATLITYTAPYMHAKCMLQQNPAYQPTQRYRGLGFVPLIPPFLHNISPVFGNPSSRRLFDRRSHYKASRASYLVSPLRPRSVVLTFLCFYSSQIAKR